jgi:hypothetical protein
MITAPVSAFRSRKPARANSALTIRRRPSGRGKVSGKIRHGKPAKDRLHRGSPRINPHADMILPHYFTISDAPWEYNLFF